MIIRSNIPAFGVNYDVGYIGFTMTSGDVISEGIAWFERWERLSDIEVSHAFVVTGNDELVEAHIERGVQRDCISKYFNDANVAVFFRKPQILGNKYWAREAAKEIRLAAESKIGCPYARGLIAADLLEDSILGHEIKQFCRWPARLVRKAFNRPNRFICSELAAYAVKKGYRELGITHFSRGCVLNQPLDSIDPQALFEDEETFEDWAEKNTPAKAGTPNAEFSAATQHRPTTSP